MTDPNKKDYIVVVRCHIVAEHCSGYRCEKSFHQRTGGFADYPREKTYRTLYLTCGGCCGQAVQRKVTELARHIKKDEDVGKDRIVVQLSSCITKDNYHGPPCPHLDYLKTVISRAGLDVGEDTMIGKTSERKRREGRYAAS